jgi:ubiquinone/menaquinone biosynthesis C-methylase UbiE
LSNNNLQDYKNLASTYDETRYTTEEHQFIDSFREEVFLDLLAPSKDMTVLDVGTGTGSGVIFFADRVKKIVGLDGTQEMLDVAKSKIDAAGIDNVELVHSNALEIPYENGTFDNVTSLNFIHLFAPHGLDLQQKFIREMGRVLKPGGHIIIEFDNLITAPELGNRYNDLEKLGEGFKMVDAVGTYLPKTLWAYKLGKSIGRFYGNLCKLSMLRPYAHKWVVKYQKV